MTEFSYIPNFPLNQFVEIIWFGKSDNVDIKSSHHAALFTELIFNYGDTFNVKGQNIENLSNTDSHHIISGLKTKPFSTEVSGEYNSIGLILKPFCYGLLINKFGSKSMDILSEILFEYVYKPEKPDFKTTENHLIKLFKDFELDKDLIKFENYLSSETIQKGALKKFNLSLSITQKSFIQKFKKHYLLTPNQYIKLRKVNYAIQLIKKSNFEKLTHVGLDAGFYDQSHFIKIFKEFCGINPKQFRDEG